MEDLAGRELTKEDHFVDIERGEDAALATQFLLEGSFDASDAERLVELMVSSAESVREDILETLMNLGLCNEDIVNSLRKHVEHVDLGVRMAVFFVLSSNGSEADVSFVLSKLHDPDPNVRKMTVEATSNVEEAHWDLFLSETDEGVMTEISQQVIDGMKPSFFGRLRDALSTEWQRKSQPELGPLQYRYMAYILNEMED